VRLLRQAPEQLGDVDRHLLRVRIHCLSIKKVAAIIVMYMIL